MHKNLKEIGITQDVSKLTIFMNLWYDNGSHRRCSVRKGVLRNFTGKHLCQSLFFNKVCRSNATGETLAQVFSCELCETSKSTFFTEHVWAAASRWWWWFCLAGLWQIYVNRRNVASSTLRKVFKYGVFSGPYFPLFGLNTEI